MTSSLVAKQEHETLRARCHVPLWVVSFPILVAPCACDSMARPAQIDLAPPMDAAAVSDDSDFAADRSTPATESDAFDPFGSFDRTIPGRPDAKPDAAVPRSDNEAGSDELDSGAPDAGPDAIVEAGDGIVTTMGLLAAQSARCVACAGGDNIGGLFCLAPDDMNSGIAGICETVQGPSRQAGRSEGEFCIQTLQRIFATSCASGGLTPCLCGSADPNKCQSGGAEPDGPLYQLYFEDFGIDIHSIVSNFTVTTYGAGQANALVQCLTAYCAGECLGGIMSAGASAGGP